MKHKSLIDYTFDRCEFPIYEAWAKGRKVPIFKTLLSSFCKNDCLFCEFRASRRCPRDRWKNEELIRAVLNLFKKRKIEGLFLSSCVEKDPSSTSQRMISIAEELRKNGFDGYIHLRLMPGTNDDLLKRAVEVADRVGINFEFPKRSYYDEIKIGCNFITDVRRKMKKLSRYVERAKKEGKCLAGISTQFVVGIEGNDVEFLRMCEWLYRDLKLSRVYFSAFIPIKNTPLEKLKPERKLRERRLYQASFLIRDYNFSWRDFVYDENGNLILEADPKYLAAKKAGIKIDINNADFSELIRIPGIGKAKAIEIIRNRPLDRQKAIKILPKKAIPFVQLKGKSLIDYV